MTMLQPARTNRTLTRLSGGLGKAGFETQLDETGLTFQAAGHAPAHIGLSTTADTWALQVQFTVDDLDAARGAARQFAAQHGGRIRLRGQTLILSTDLARPELEDVVALYHMASILQGLLDAGHPHATP